MTAKSSPQLSVVIPFYNEAGAIPSLISGLVAVLETLALPYELVLVNDGSKDQTASAIEDAARRLAGCRVFHLEKNSGQAAALLFGFQQATAPLIVTLDGDGQNRPEDIPNLLRLLGDADMIVGIRVQRSDTRLRRMMSRIANAVRSRLLRDGMLDSGCALKVFRREVCTAFIPIRSLYSFMPALAVAAGYRVIQSPVRHQERTTGQSNYGLCSFAWRPACDMLMIWWYSKRRCPRTRATVRQNDATNLPPAT